MVRDSYNSAINELTQVEIQECKQTEHKVNGEYCVHGA